MKQILIAAALIAASATSAQSLEYDWLSQPCSTMLNCDSGCSACLAPEAEGATFTGTAAVWYGIDACPHPIAIGDNAVWTYGWPIAADPGHYVIITGFAFSPVTVDSIIIRHASEADGPQRLSVRYGANTTMPATVVSDVSVPGSYSETIVTGLGPVVAADGMIYGFFQILLQAYDGGTGAWMLDDMRVVASPYSATGIDELSTLQRETGSTVAYDALGKATGRAAANGLYLAGTKVVVLR